MTSGISGVGGDGSALANLSAELAAQGIRAMCLRTTLTL